MPLARGEAGRDQILRSVEKDDADIVAAVHEDVAIGALQRRAGDDGALAGGREAVDLVGNRLQPRPAVLVRQRMAGAHLGDVACRVKPVAVLVAPAEPPGETIGDGALARAGDAHHHQRARSLTAHQNSPESRPGPPARPSRRWIARGWRAGSRLRTAASRSHACRAPATSNSISRQEARVGSVRVTRGTNGSTFALGTPTTQRAVSSSAGSPGNSDAVWPSGPTPISTRSNRGRASIERVCAVERLQFLFVKRGAAVGIGRVGGRGRNRMDVCRRRASVQESRSRHAHVVERVIRRHEAFVADEPVHALPRDPASIGLASQAIDRAASGSIRRSGRSPRGRCWRLFWPAHVRRRSPPSPLDRRP